MPRCSRRAPVAAALRCGTRSLRARINAELHAARTRPDTLGGFDLSRARFPAAEPRPFNGAALLRRDGAAMRARRRRAPTYVRRRRARPSTRSWRPGTAARGRARRRGPRGARRRPTIVSHAPVAASVALDEPALFRHPPAAHCARAAGTLARTGRTLPASARGAPPRLAMAARTASRRLEARAPAPAQEFARASRRRQRTALYAWELAPVIISMESHRPQQELLVRALTGVLRNRFQEKKRGITIGSASRR